MATAAKTGPQDMPPPGGYGNITYERVKLKTIIRGRTILGLVLGSIAIGATILSNTLRRRKTEKREVLSGYFAIYPLLLAEKERRVLKYLHGLRAEEEKLMRNFPEWEVGTLLGEPIYKTIPKEQVIIPTEPECYMHSDPEESKFRRTFWMYR
ncbi:NADH dehydrogenase [ubiquinone] 1 alpha subcomplex subunit 13 [Orussus abietinus]|uniref:NADH dehydrogenase [ubiquinone] 1 alpha subcomplex subunit 13 n=1 Tax=Orussus abietinus TaxID=222816 RepID=UPI000625455E|nr:NADH dehydrogenase [ubiquinone] 1 alpha subcomplex subunit 13 [Orussus abietinus]